MASMRNNNTTYQPWMLAYVEHSLNPMHQDTIYTPPTNFLCVIQKINRKLQINSYTQTTSTADCDNELIVADGKHSIKCYFKGLLGTMYIENKIINLKLFHLEIDEFQREVYFVASCSQIYKPNLKIIDIYNICATNINTDTNVQKLLSDRYKYNQSNQCNQMIDYTHPYTDNYTNTFTDTFHETFVDNDTMQLHIPFPCDCTNAPPTNEPPTKKPKLNNNQMVTHSTQSSPTTHDRYSNLPKFSLSNSDSTSKSYSSQRLPSINMFTNCNNALADITTQCSIPNVTSPNVNNSNVGGYSDRYTQRMNTFCDGIENKMKPLNNNSMSNGLQMDNINDNKQYNYNRKMNAFTDDFDDEQYVIPKKIENNCNYTNISPPPQSSVFCPNISSQ